MKATIQRIGPETAESLLQYNTRNRTLRDAHAAKLAADMAAGQWRDGSTLLFAGTGEDRILLDGQHRLQAVVDSKTDIDFIVVEGLSPDDQQAVDTGLRRSLADVLHWKGETCCGDLGGAIAWQWRYERGMMRSKYTPTVAQALAVLDEHPGLRDSLAPTRQAARTLRIPRGCAAWLFYAQRGFDQEDAEVFWDLLATGLVPEANEHHPVHVLRRQLEANSRAVARKLDTAAITALIVKGWNAYRDGRDVSMLVWRRGGAHPEPFPEMR